jgi:hypothetical protein
VTNLLRTPALGRARGLARKWTDTHLQRPVARALKVRTALRHGRGRVVYFGDSSLIHIAPHDADRRRLGEMLAGAAGTEIAQYYGPGYSAALHAEMARLMRDLPRPRCVVVSLVIRPTTHLHVLEHPVFGHASAIRALHAAPALDARLLRKLYKSPPTTADYARFEAIERASRWGYADTIGEYRRRLRAYNPFTADESQQQVLYDYFHGEYSEGHRGLEDWHNFGAQLRALDVPVVAYRTYMPLDRGTELLGDTFVPHIEHNFALLEERFFAGLGGGTSLPIDALSDSEFVAPTDATEHLNETGRAHIVDALLPAIKAHLA